MLAGNNIMLGVSGSIAAYKAVELLRRMTEAGADVRVVVTKNACRFVTPITFGALCDGQVLVDEFEDWDRSGIGHIDMSRGLDAAVIAPATANIIGKIACGIGDDALSSTILALECPVLVAPAMNDRMFRNPAVRRNIDVLRERGMRIIEPETGALACGTEGRGRLASVQRIMDELLYVLSPKDLAGVRVLVTAGPTREHIDPVRFISNPSTGRMGYALAEAARDRGADVILVSGPTHLARPWGVEFHLVVTAEEMRSVVMERAQDAKVVIMAAAVSDFRPRTVSGGKIKKDAAQRSIELEQTADILADLGKDKAERILVGFAAETESIKENAMKKLKSKSLDMIVANEVNRTDAGFGAETNKALIIDRFGGEMDVPLMPKKKLSQLILDKVSQLLERQGISP